MKRRLFALLLALAMCAALSLTARADVLFVPDDDFYEDHLEKMIYVNSGYIANGPGGVLTIYASPENSLVKGTAKNGEGVYVSVRYTDADGIAWAQIELFEQALSGWVPMDYLVKVYNSDDFWAEFGDRITEESGSLSPSENAVWFWYYPGSPSADVSIALEGDYLPEYHSVFVDDAGRKWGNVGYYMGIKNTWVCLSNPTADYETLYADAAPQQVTLYEITEPTAEIKPDGISPAVAIGAAAAVAAVSAAILVVMKKRK